MRPAPAIEWPEEVLGVSESYDDDTRRAQALRVAARGMARFEPTTQESP
ncbi:MAG: hypothetical protein NVSMB55_03830 [Mycobacteriales bacterium]